ncbi:hypothetical protein HMPREF0860_2137 [Treponema socranskii subsp. socranskii VPI DR56BR1116 = ATCC 35536]|uniref:Uncharacterized protein n=1 Tax=Treponema socranskii subsp. socranskii VPI DR56BR1116 = ATCC 35536 TaxID=1125725 RepID=U1GWH9_TRESO|nr:hypothetical protein HMPREF1325_0847 [Treponema socranskii subsp. socranskii VPI DR56BR1116 = ATCC 35536]ERK00168.1 hypothetical protein HMPREF0860_2137 [Treponema socranskii subsp. socranskii VPI DR56BR1116 = ATCC 35536]
MMSFLCRSKTANRSISEISSSDEDGDVFLISDTLSIGVLYKKICGFTT